MRRLNTQSMMLGRMMMSNKNNLKRAANRSGSKRFNNTATTKTQSFAEKAHVDTMVYVGAASFVGILGFNNMSSLETRENLTLSVIDGWYRGIGGVKPERVTDEQLVGDYMKKYMAACRNCLMASPAFYFLYHFIHKQGFTVSLARSITGTIRIVPIMAIMYGATGLMAPLLNNYFQGQGQSYEGATMTSQVVILIGGMSFLESIVELQGCGVPLSHITPGALLIFMPALIGRIVAGVFVQASKTGQEFENVLPPSWKEENAAEWQKQVNKAFDALCIDTSFFVTLFGTGVCQYILNGVTFILLQKGRSMKISDVGRYITGGIGGSGASATYQFGKTLGMRFGFCSLWNWLSSQPLDFPSMTSAIEKRASGTSSSSSSSSKQ